MKYLSISNDNYAYYTNLHERMVVIEKMRSDEIELKNE